MEGAEQRQLPPGTMLDDKYRVDELLAVGGMGAVYVGTHMKLRKRVALKVLNPALSSPPMIERFHREAITASQIGHEGIAQVTDLGMSGFGEPFLVMELLEGESLGRRLKASGPLPIEVACELGCSILSPLDAAHRAGIIHRDLKPDNVFLVRQSRGELVKLLDFGISRAAGLEAEFRLTTTGLVLGTPYYMSPEQARGDGVITPAADIYSFGVILYEMLVGQVPIIGDNYNQLMYRVMTGDYRPPRERRPEIPPELEQIILQAMAADPLQRPRSAAELEHALLAFCRPTFREHTIERISAQGLPRLTPLPTPYRAMGTDHMQPTPAPTQARRSRLPVILGVAVVLLVGGGITIAAMSGSPSTPTPTPTPPPPTTAVTPPPTPPPTPTPPPAATPSTITIRFAITPTNAEVDVDSARVGSDSLVVAKDAASHHVHITAPGYVAHDEDVKFDESQRLDVDLAHEAVHPVAVPHPHTPATTTPPKSHTIESQSPYGN